MSNFVIHREHGISKAQAFEITEDWIVSAEKDYKMHCDVVRSDEQIRVNFSRAGVTGTLTVDDKVFNMQAKLGFLFKSFLPLIEKTVNQNLDNALQAVKDR